jgi:hypothetical protein
MFMAQLAHVIPLVGNVTVWVAMLSQPGS